MLTTLAAMTLVSLTMQGQTDTTFAVPAGASLSVNNFGGAITVHGWNQDRVKVHAEHGRRGRVEVSLVGGTVMIKSGTRQGAPSVVDIEVTVPQAMALVLSGTYAEITVDGVTGSIQAETVNGEVNVRGGKGNITLHSIQGSVTLADASGRIEVNSVNEDVALSNVSGELKVETTNGEVTLTGIRSSSVEAGTINGDVLYEGTITDGGSYSFASHNGDITVSVPDGANVTVTTATANGDIDASFPLPLTVTPSKRRYTFKLGTGSARMELESFQGDIQLRRPNELQDRMRHKHKNDEGHDGGHGYDSDHDSDFDYNHDFNYDVSYDFNYDYNYDVNYDYNYDVNYNYDYTYDYDYNHDFRSTSNAWKGVKWR